MARELTKKKSDGSLYKRPHTVEKQITKIEDASRDEILEWISHSDTSNDRFLSSECLVYLIRSAVRENDQIMTDRALPVLLARCEQILESKVSDAAFSDANFIREEILGRLAELIAEDAANSGSSKLDMYECRFNLAFRTLRIDTIRSETSRMEAVQDLSSHRLSSDTGEEMVDEEVLAYFSEAARSPALQESNYNHNQLLDAMGALPKKERDALTLHALLGCKVESIDPNEITVATKLNCSGRTVRNLIARATGKLERFKEDL